MLQKCLVNLVTSELCRGLAEWIHGDKTSSKSWGFDAWLCLGRYHSATVQKNPLYNLVAKGQNAIKMNKNDFPLSLRNYLGLDL